MSARLFSRQRLLRFRASLGVALVALVAPCSDEALAAGARLFKSGPIQTDAAGLVWVANRDDDSVTRIDVSGLDPMSGLGWSATEFAIPEAGCSPRGLSVSEDGSEVWVTCHDRDSVHVLDGSDGSPITRIDLPWGSGPYSVALSRPDLSDPMNPQQAWALVTLHRGAGIAAVDALSKELIKIIEPTFWSPLAIAWMEDGSTAYVSHLFADGEHPRLGSVSFADPSDPKYTMRQRLLPTFPQKSWNIPDDGDGATLSELGEGGYLLVRGHVAQVPAGQDGSRLWMTTQYQNIHSDRITPDTVVQASIRKLDPLTRKVPDSNQNFDKLIVSAAHVHAVQNGGGLQGEGWNAPVSGPLDLAFSADGTMSWFLYEQSENLLEVPTDTPPIKPSGASPLRSVDVGARPLGLATSPVSEMAFVSNTVDRSVSVIDLASLTTIATIPVSSNPDPIPASLRLGERIFHTSNDPAISRNRKVSCASCHLNAEHDGRIWDFQWLTTSGMGQQGSNAPTPTGPGSRHTQTLLGLNLSFGAGGAGGRDPLTGFGMLHHSGDRDEVQDFEHTFRSTQMGGTGFVAGAPPAPLGPLISGMAPELDAMADYVLNLQQLARSPHREGDGSLSEAARRGATFFVGADPAKPADSQCAACHDPTTNFTDHGFHDVGQRRPASENELNAGSRAPYQWHVGTPSLVGVWATPPYEGIFSGGGQDLLAVAVDAQIQTGRSGGNTHGDSSGLTRRQLRDLAEFVGSIDLNMSPSEVLNARDVEPPRIERVEPVSLGLISIWFSESMNPSVADPALWRVAEIGAGDVAITGASFDPQNGDRMYLDVDSLRSGCDAVTYEVAPVGVLLDIADSATGGVANAMDLADPANIHRFDVTDSMTITLGASGYDSLTVHVHDAATVNPSQNPNWGHGSLYFGAFNGGAQSPTGFLRFEWSDSFRTATGVSSSANILEAALVLHPDFGDAQVVDLRRMLVAWDDTAPKDWSNRPNGAPTWNSRAHGSASWNTRNAAGTVAGFDGSDPAHYDGAADTADVLDLSAQLPAINEAFAFTSARVTEAYRFWFDNPSLDYGHALRVNGSPINELRFQASEQDLSLFSPSLRVTYALPPSLEPQPGEVSAPASLEPLRLRKVGSDLALVFEDVGPAGRAYSVYEGGIGSWYSHDALTCLDQPAPVGPAALESLVRPGAGSHYYLVTASGTTNEGPSGSDSTGTSRDATDRRSCGGTGCP